MPASDSSSRRRSSATTRRARSPGRLVAAAALLCCACGVDEMPVRVVLVTLDTLRADAFDERHMPLLRARAARGLVFEHFYAATSSTQPTHATLFTGLEPWRHGVTRNGAVLDEAHDTLAERFRAAGFATSAVVASFPLERRFGFAQGFDGYDDRFDLVQGKAEKPMQVWSGAEVDEGAFYSLADTITAKALAALDAARGRRQLFWFHYFDPHAPYGDCAGEGIALSDLTEAAARREPDLEARLERAREGYGEDARHLDRSLERLLARLEEEAERFETHVLVTSDHGESFGEDGSLGHGKRLIRSQVHVPGFLLSPRVSPALREDAAGSLDVLPTLLALAGIGGARDLPGRDLSAPAPAKARPVMGMRRTFHRPFRDVRTDGSVVLVQGPQFFLVHEGRLHVGDGERIESEGQAPDADFLEGVRALFSACERELTGRAGREDLAPGTQRALEALGYTR